MGSTQENRRVAYTKQALKDALLELLEEKDIEKVTVTDLCKQANINRGTFYLHYDSPYHLLNSMEEEMFLRVTDLIEEHLEPYEIRNLLLEIFDVIEHNKAFCKIILVDMKQQSTLRRILYKANEVLHSKVSKEVAPSAFLDYGFSFVAEGVIGVIRSWIQNDYKEDVSEIVDIIMYFIIGMDEENVPPLLRKK